MDLSIEVLWVSAGQEVTKLQSVKLWRWSNHPEVKTGLPTFGLTLTDQRIFFKPLTFTACNFAALWPPEMHSTSLEKNLFPTFIISSLLVNYYRLWNFIPWLVMVLIVAFVETLMVERTLISFSFSKYFFFPIENIPNIVIPQKRLKVITQNMSKLVSSWGVNPLITLSNPRWSLSNDSKQALIN